MTTTTITAGDAGVRGERHINEISGAIVSAAMQVHTELGPGLLESAYEACLAWELRQRGFELQTQLPLPPVYHGVKLEAGYRIDILVNNAVIVEVKSVEALAPIHEAQVISHI